MPRVGERVDLVRSLSQRRLTAVGITCGIGSMLVGARQAGFDVVGNIEWRRYYHAVDGEGRNTFLENFPGAFMKEKVEDLDPDELEKATGCDLAIGHPESFRPDVPIYTSKGWVPIGEVEVGDLILTHRGRFRRVYRAFHYKAPRNTDEITFSRNSRKSSSALVTTGNHPILMEDGTWRAARDVRKGERISYLCDRCPRCKELTPVSPQGKKTCYCDLREEWARLGPAERRERNSPAFGATRGRVARGVHDFTDSEVRRKGQLVQARRSRAEEVIRGALRVPLVPQFPVGNYFVDFAVEGEKIAVEVDGGCWHRTERKRDQDNKKEDFLRAEGWTVVRVQVRSERLDSPACRRAIQSCAEEVSRLLKNHSGAYEFGSFVVGGLWRSTYEEGEPLCNLSVEEDETYIANGYVVHNCGLYSAMQGCNNFRAGKKKAEKQKDPGDIPLFLDLLATLRPRFFVMDDLPKSFLACPMEEYVRRLPDYDLFPEWISNYHYGNVQKKRIRMFMVGALKSEGFSFRPGEQENDLVLSGAIGDLPVFPTAGDLLNHDPHTESELAGRALHMDYLWHRPTYGDYRAWMEARPEGTVFEYHSTSGGIKKKPGWYKQRWDRPCAVVDGGSGHTHPLRNLPFTLRERARIQGFPDDFGFYGTKLAEDGTWNHERNIHMVKQTGKAMPIQFCRYVSEQIAAHILGREFSSSGARMVRPDPYVDEAKRWYCQNIGYSDQVGACRACWMADQCEIRRGKYGLGEVEVPVSKAEIKVGLLEPSLKRKRVSLATQEAESLALSKPVRLARRARLEAVQTDIETEVVVLTGGKGSSIRPPPKVEVKAGAIPDDYHCQCEFCSQVIGELRPPDGGYYSRLERRGYYAKVESGKNGHAAKTPLHIARWAVQEFTRPGDWVLDPTIGAGTTAVEALVQGRNAVGMELQYGGILQANVELHAVGDRMAVLGLGDARKLGEFLQASGIAEVDLVVNNPPYSGDEHHTTFNITEQRREAGDRSTTFEYDRALPNIAFLREGDEYWRTIDRVYRECVRTLRVGGRFVVGVKDMMRAKQPFLLHRELCLVLAAIPGLEFEGTAFLRHWPGTLFLHSYEKIHGAKPPLYQTISVFRRTGGGE